MTEDKFIPIKKLTKDLMAAMDITSPQEARYLVDNYYILQENRIRSYAQGREMVKTQEPHEVIKYLAGQSEILENEIRRALDRYTTSHPVAAWLKSNCGIAEVISAGLISNLDIKMAPTAGHFWSYAGITPDKNKKKRGEKINYNPAVKRIILIAADCIVKVSNNENAFYGKLYKERKEYETAKNEAGDYKDQAILKAKTVGKGTDAYQWYSGFWVINPELNPNSVIDENLAEELQQIRKKAAKNFDGSGIASKEEKKELLAAAKMEAVEEYLKGKELPLRPMLPPAHIQARVKRYVGKMILSHLHEVWYWHEYKKAPPAPYSMVFAGHAHKIEVPNKPSWVLS